MLALALGIASMTEGGQLLLPLVDSMVEILCRYRPMLYFLAFLLHFFLTALHL